MLSTLECRYVDISTMGVDRSTLGVDMSTFSLSVLINCACYVCCKSSHALQMMDVRR